MKRIFVCLLLSLLVLSPVGVFAQAASLSDIEAAIIQEDYKKANELALKVLQTKPAPMAAAQAEYYLGLSHLRLGEYPQALEVFKKVVNGRPTTDLLEKATIGMIDALYLQGYYEKALKEATALMNSRRQSEMMSLIYLKIARSNLKLARWNKAREFLEKITTEYPDSFENGIARQLLEEKQYFTVQVGAFTEKPRAEQLVNDLIRRKEYAYMIETKSPDGKLFYRVRVGHLTALKDAQALEAKLSGFGYPTRIYP